MDIGLLLHFVIALSDETLAQVDRASAGEVEVRVQPGRGDDVQRGRPPAISRGVISGQGDLILVIVCLHHTLHSSVASPVPDTVTR